MVRLSFLKKRSKPLKPGRYSVRVVDVKQVGPGVIEMVLDDVRRLK